MLVFGESGPEGVSEFELSGLQSEQSVLPELEESTSIETTVDPNEILRVEIPNFVVTNDGDSANFTVDNIPFGIQKGLSGRSGALKDALLSKFGGTAETEEAVELGLKWLAKQQKSDAK